MPKYLYLNGADEAHRWQLPDEYTAEDIHEWIRVMNDRAQSFRLQVVIDGELVPFTILPGGVQCYAIVETSDAISVEQE